MELLSVSPQQLTFYAPYDRVQTRIVTLLNPTDKVVLFKFISNACRHYGVMPTAEKVEPYDTAEIRISLRCFDFQAGEKYRHKFKIHSLHKPDNCFNGENPLAIFQRLPHGEISIKTLPVKLETRSVSLSNSGLNSLPCLKQLVLERNQQLRPRCPKCPEMLTGPSNAEKSPVNGIIYMVVVLVCLLGAYFQRQAMTEMIINFYEDPMCSEGGEDCTDYSEENFLSPEISCVNST